ncbi:MAG: hypothetical protein WC401_11975, partial [Bacteroidales bacterium]
MKTGGNIPNGTVTGGDSLFFVVLLPDTRHSNLPDTGSDCSTFGHISVLIGKNRIFSFTKLSVCSRFE